MVRVLNRVGTDLGQSCLNKLDFYKLQIPSQSSYSELIPNLRTFKTTNSLLFLIISFIMKCTHVLLILLYSDSEDIKA